MPEWVSLFVPTSETHVDERAAAACDACPAQLECLFEALANNEHGVWGGKSDRERRRIRRHLPGGRWRSAVAEMRRAAGDD